MDKLADNLKSLKSMFEQFSDATDLDAWRDANDNTIFSYLEAKLSDEKGAPELRQIRQNLRTLELALRRVKVGAQDNGNE